MAPPDLVVLADLSHELERLALSLASDGLDERFVAQEVAAKAAGEREAVAIALSYLLRHRNLGTAGTGAGAGDHLDVALAGTVTALRRLSAAAA